MGSLEQLCVWEGAEQRCRGAAVSPGGLSGGGPPWRGTHLPAASTGLLRGAPGWGKVRAGPALDRGTSWPGVGRRETGCKKTSSPALLF